MSYSSALAARGRSRLVSLFAAVSLMALVAVFAALLPTSPASAGSGGAVVVANRGSGDLSVIDVDSLAVTTVALPGDSQPMYVSHDRKNDRVIVGDRNASALVALDDETYEVVATVEVGAGVFHQWVDDQVGQVWVVGNESDSVTAVDLATFSVLATITMPADIIERGGVPHDVFVEGGFAYVSILGLDDGTGAVIQYSASTFAEVGRIGTGDDPHLFVNAGKLYVASQDAGTVSVFKARSLKPINEIAVPAAHGIYVTGRSGVVATNIAGGGTDAVWALDGGLRASSDQGDTPVPVPHNLTIDNMGQVFVTHSGATADQVSIVPLKGGSFGDAQTVTVGTNPFGLAFIR